MPKYGAFSGPYFLLFGGNTEIYGVDFRIQTKYGETWTRKKLRIRTLFVKCLVLKIHEYSLLCENETQALRLNSGPKDNLCLPSYITNKTQSHAIVLNKRYYLIGLGF